MSKLIIILLFGVISCGTFNTKDSETEMGNVATCRVKEKQSPIMVDNNKKEISNLNLSFTYLESNATIENTGHKVEVKLEDKSSLYINGKKFTLAQFHFHTPSEHNVNGKIYPLEMHMVHKSTENKFVVVGVVFKEGKENPFLAKIIQTSKLGKKNVPQTSSLKLPTEFNSKSNFYYYMGSLTTYPFMEGVDWLLKEEQMEASKSQIEYITNLEGLNARITQPVNDRKLVLVKNQ